MSGNQDLFPYHEYKIENKILKSCGCQGVGGRMELELGLSRCRLAYIRMDKQGPTLQHREPYSISCDKPE